MAPGGLEQVRLQCMLEDVLRDRSGDRSAGGRRFHVAGPLTAKLHCPVAVRARGTNIECQSLQVAESQMLTT